MTNVVYRNKNFVLLPIFLLLAIGGCHLQKFSEHIFVPLSDDMKANGRHDSKLDGGGSGHMTLKVSHGLLIYAGPKNVKVGTYNWNRKNHKGVVVRHHRRLKK